MGDLTRFAALAASGLAVAGAISLTAGCGTSSKEAPSTSTSSSSPSAPPPSEKGLVGNMPPRAFNENMNAADGILALESEGYNVEINWGGGRTDQNLSLCRIGGVNGLRGSGSVTPGTSVYVTVIC
ncbi:MAG: hypothetical protein ACOYO2_04350 [Mycobacterium sp.]